MPDLALVAVLPGGPNAPDGQAGEPPIVGHVMLSGTELVTDDGDRVPVLIVSPLGVLPANQGRGIGAALCRAVLTLADARPEPLVIVQGHPAYYPRFGFVHGRMIGILPPEHLGAIDQAWMARPGPRWTAGLHGRVVYPEAFLALD